MVRTAITIAVRGGVVRLRSASRLPDGPARLTVPSAWRSTKKGRPRLPGTGLLRSLACRWLFAVSG